MAFSREFIFPERERERDPRRERNSRGRSIQEGEEKCVLGIAFRHPPMVVLTN